MWVNEPALEKNKPLQFKTIGEIAKMQNKRVIDAFLDLVVEEKLETRFLQAENNIDDEAVKRILTYPNAFIGLGDGGAHVQFHGGYGYTTRLLGEWVREKQAMTLEQAVRRLTFESASLFGISDRGLLREGLAADIVLFDPDTVKPGPESVVHDFPAGGWRIKEPAVGVHMTIVNGQVLLEDGKHTGALPGRVMRNWLVSGASELGTPERPTPEAQSASGVCLRRRRSLGHRGHRWLVGAAKIGVHDAIGRSVEAHAGPGRARARASTTPSRSACHGSKGRGCRRCAPSPPAAGAHGP